MCHTQLYEPHGHRLLCFGYINVRIPDTYKNKCYCSKLTMEDQPEHQKQRITKIFYEPDARLVAEEIKFRIQSLYDDEQKRALSELVNDFTSKE